MKPPNYKSLHLPPPDTAEKTLKRKIMAFVFKGAEEKAQGRSLVNQLNAREFPVPPEVWGTDPRRLEVATTMAKLIKDEICWPNAHFIPDDPIELLLFNYTYAGWDFDGMEVEFILISLEEIYEIVFDQDVLDSMLDLTFGEVVDTVIDLQSNPQTVKEKNTLWTTEGSASLESMPCPTLATFLDIRGYVERNEQEVPRITPATRLKDLKNHKGFFRALNKYVAKRFGVQDTLIPNVEHLDPVYLGLSASFVVVAVIYAFLGVVFALYPEAFDSSVWLAVLFFPLLGLLVTAAISFPLLFSRTFWRRLLNKRPKLETVAELIKHILSERKSGNIQAVWQLNAPSDPAP